MSIQIDDTMVHINDEDVPIAAVADTSKQGDEPEQLESTPCTTNTCTDDLKAMAGGSEEKITSVQNEAMKNEGPVPLDEKTNIKKDIGANSTTRTDKQDTIDDDDDDDATNANSKINNGNNEKDIETAMSIPYQDQEGGGRNKKSSSLSPSPSPSPPNNNDEQLQQSFTTNSTSTPGAIAIDNPLFDGLTTTISGMMDASTATTTATSRNSSNPSSSLGPSRIETSLATTTDLHTTASTSLMSLMTHTAELGSSYHHVEAICIDEQTVYEATPVVNNDDSNHQDDSNGENDDDNDEENPSKNKQDQPSLKACFSRYRLYIIIIIATVMIAAISIVLGIVLTGGQQQEAAQQTEEQQQRWEAMRAIVAPLSIGGEYEAIFDTENPESSSSSTDARIDALNWIVDIDPAKLPIDGGPDVEWKIRQRYVLALLYFSTNGSGWDEQYSFLSGFDECKWTSVQTQADDDDNPYRINGFEVKGVVCNREGEVETLRMWWNNMSGTIPPELSSFSESLIEINIGGGSISGPIPSSFGELVNLEGLILNDNCLTGTVPEQVLDIYTLTIFTIYNNNNNDLSGSSLNGFCAGSTHMEGMLSLVADCEQEGSNDDDGNGELPSSFIECDCCICCNPDNFTCSDTQGNSWNSYYLESYPRYSNSLPKSFQKQCLSKKSQNWIEEECPCVIADKSNDNNELIRTCTMNCTEEGAVRSTPY